MIQPKDLTDLELVVGGTTAAAPVFIVDLYTDKLFSTIPEQVLACYEMFLRLCPPERIKHYATETMDQHKETSSRTFTMLPSWLKKGAAPRKYIYLELLSGDNREAVPDFRFLVAGYEPGSIGHSARFASLLRICVPAAWGGGHASEMRDMVIHLAGLIPYTAGHAGFAMDWSRYFEQKACPHAYQKGMRHLGFDVPGESNDCLVVGHDSMKTVNWLTLLGQPLLSKLGGVDQIRARASNRIKLRPTGGGLMLEAGDAPEVGDVNRGDPLPAYAEVYKLVEPVAEVGIQRSKAMTFLPGDEHQNTLRWLRRFAEKP